MEIQVEFFLPDPSTLAVPKPGAFFVISSTSSSIARSAVIGDSISAVFRQGSPMSSGRSIPLLELSSTVPDAAMLAGHASPPVPGKGKELFSQPRFRLAFGSNK